MDGRRRFSDDSLVARHGDDHAIAYVLMRMGTYVHSQIDEYLPVCIFVYADIYGRSLGRWKLNQIN